MHRGWHYAKLSLSNARSLSFSGMCILLFLFLSLCRLCLFVFFILLSLEPREAEEADKVEVAPGVIVASLRRFRTALIGPTQGLPKRRRLCR